MCPDTISLRDFSAVTATSHQQPLHLYVAIVSKELVKPSHKPQPDFPMPSISPGNTTAQTSITAPHVLGVGKSGQEFPVKSQ